VSGWFPGEPVARCEKIMKICDYAGLTRLHNEAGWSVYLPGNGWQQYGWDFHGATYSQSWTGSPVAGQWDSSHWNWSVLVIYSFCGEDGREHVTYQEAAATEFTWDANSQSWGDPHKGSYQ